MVNTHRSSKKILIYSKTQLESAKNSHIGFLHGEKIPAESSKVANTVMKIYIVEFQKNIFHFPGKSIKYSKFIGKLSKKNCLMDSVREQLH